MEVILITITFSHIANGRRIPLLDDEGREVTLSIDAVDKTSAINSAVVKTFIAQFPGKVDLRVRRCY